MANTYTLIASNTLSSSAASVTFSSIPNTYTDLVLKVSVRDSYVGNGYALRVRFNNDSGSVYSVTQLDGSGSSAGSGQTSNDTKGLFGATNAANDTSNTFSNTEIYIPNYLANANKPASGFGVSENNSSTGNKIFAHADLWRNTAAINRVDFVAVDNFVSGSSFFLYGIKNS